MSAGQEIDGEGEFAIGLKVPTGAVKVVGVGVSEGEAFPAKSSRLPANA